MEKESLSKIKTSLPDNIKIKCPHCFQVFTAFPKEFEVRSPHFACTSCHNQFWIEPLNTQKNDNSLPLMGYPISIKKPDIFSSMESLGLSLKICPKCSQEVNISAQSCPFCHLVFMKMLEGIEGSVHLRGLWARLLCHWHDESKHDQFIVACHKAGDLLYGIFCYGKILKEDKNNAKAKQMIKKIEALTWFFQEEKIPNFIIIQTKKIFLKFKKLIKRQTANILASSLILLILTILFA